MPRRAIVVLTLLPLALTACANTVPSQRLKAFPGQGQDLTRYKQDSWECDNASVEKSDTVGSYWWAGLIGMAIAKSNIEGKEDSAWRSCMEAKNYRVAGD